MIIDAQTTKMQNASLIKSAVKRFADKTKKNKLRSVMHLLNFLYKNCSVKKIEEYRLSDFEALFLFLEKKKISKKMKVRYRADLRDVVFYAIRNEIASGHFELKTKYDFIFSDSFFSFSESSERREIIRIGADDIQRFLSECRKKDINDYIWFSILSYSACRISGLCNLVIKDIRFSERMFITQEKKTKTSSGLNKYFLPDYFIGELQVFIKRNNLKQTDRICWLTDKQIRMRLKRYRAKWWPHLFRHTIRSLWHLRGMPGIEAELLLNHRVRDLECVYLQQLNNKEHLRKIYDKYFPY